MDLALNNLQRLICHKTQPTNQLKTKTKPKQTEKIKKKRDITLTIFSSIFKNKEPIRGAYDKFPDFFRMGI